MAAFDILTWSTTNDRSKRTPSQSNTFDFQAIRIGANNLQIAQASSTAFDFSNLGISNVANPVSAQDAATKAYVDAVATGLTVKTSAQAATTTVLAANTYNNGTAGVGATLTGNSNGALAAMDGYTPVLNDRLLIKNEAAGANNGVYKLTQVGSGGAPYILTRTTDADTCQPAANPKVTSGMFLYIENGTANAGQGWVLTTPDPITLGTTSLVFTQFSSATAFSAGNGIQIAANTISARIDGNALQFSSGIITLTLNGATLNSGASGLKVSSAGITPTELNASVAGNGLTGGAGSALAVLANGATLNVSGSGVKVSTAGITPTELNTSVAGNGITGGGGSALAVVADADATLVVAAGGVRLNSYDALINDNAGTVSAAQIVYIKTNGHVDLASNTVATNFVRIGIVKDATILTTATGNIYTQQGVKVGGFSGLTPGAPVFVSNTAGAVVQTTSGFTAGQFLYQVGYALTATTIRFQPEFLVEW